MVVALVSIVLTATAMVMDLPASTATAIAALRRYGIGGKYVVLEMLLASFPTIRNYLFNVSCVEQVLR